MAATGKHSTYPNQVPQRHTSLFVLIVLGCFLFLLIEVSANNKLVFLLIQPIAQEEVLTNRSSCVQVVARHFQCDRKWNARLLFCLNSDNDYVYICLLWWLSCFCAAMFGCCDVYMSVWGWKGKTKCVLVMLSHTKMLGRLFIKNIKFINMKHIFGARHVRDEIKQRQMSSNIMWRPRQKWDTAVSLVYR